MSLPIKWLFYENRAEKSSQVEGLLTTTTEYNMHRLEKTDKKIFAAKLRIPRTLHAFETAFMGGIEKIWGAV
jgi:hypothetical protein